MKSCYLLAGVCLILVFLVPEACFSQTSVGNENAIAGEKNGSAFVVARTKSTFQGTNFVAELSLSQLEASPRWNGETKPPLSPKEAETLATNFLNHYFGQVLENGFPASSEPWRKLEIALRSWGHENCWFYEVKMKPLISGTYNYPPVTVFITMDGKAGILKAAH